MKVVAKFTDPEIEKFVTDSFQVINQLRTEQGFPRLSDKVLAAQFLVDAATRFHEDLKKHLSEQQQQESNTDVQSGTTDTVTEADTTEDK